MKTIRSNIGFIASLIVLAVIAFNPEAKALVMQGLLKTGLFNPISHNMPTAAPVETPLKAPVLFRSSTGATVDLTVLKGKVVFLNFWATWCPPCRAEMPSVNRLFNKLKNNGDVMFMMADADANLVTSEKFMKKKKYDLPVYIPTSVIPDQLFSGSLPTTVILNKKGQIAFRHEGMADYDSPEMVKFLSDLAKE